MARVRTRVTSHYCHPRRLTEIIKDTWPLDWVKSPSHTVCQAQWHLHVAPHAAAGPLVVSSHQHVLDHGLDGHLAHHPHEEELLYHGGRHRPQGGQPQQQLAEPGGLVGVVSPAVLLQRALGLLLETLDDLRWRQSDSVWKYQNSIKNASENLNKIWRMWR